MCDHVELGSSWDAMPALSCQALRYKMVRLSQGSSLRECRVGVGLALQLHACHHNFGRELAGHSSRRLRAQRRCRVDQLRTTLEQEDRLMQDALCRLGGLCIREWC